MTDNTDITMDEIVDAMILYGGSFASTLGTLYRKGDAVNQERLVVAFNDYFFRYRELALLAKLKPAQR
jgi:hypothetical protein